MGYRTKKNRIGIILVILMELMPVINQYQELSLTFWELFSMIAVIYGLIKAKGRICKMTDTAYLFFSLYVLLSCLLFSLRYTDLSVGSILMRSLKFIVVTVFVLFIAPHFLFNIELIRKVYKYLLCTISIILIFQIMSYYFLGNPFYAIIPNITLNYNDGVNSSVLIDNNLRAITAGYYYRPSSVFLEPAYYALFSIPGISLILFNQKISKSDIILSIFFTICAILTTSSLALVGCSICWITFLIFRKDLWKKNWIRMVGLIICIIPLAIYFLMQQGGVLTSVNIKLASLANMSEESSTSLRLLRGLHYYNQMDIFSQMFGTGYGNLSAYYYQNGIQIIGDSNSQVSYMNGISTVLCSFGLFGMILFITFIVHEYKKGNPLTRSLIICLVTVMFASDMFDSIFYYLFMFLILGENRYLRVKFETMAFKRDKSDENRNNYDPLWY